MRRIQVERLAKGQNLFPTFQVKVQVTERRLEFYTAVV